LLALNCLKKLLLAFDKVVAKKPVDACFKKVPLPQASR